MNYKYDSDMAATMKYDAQQLVYLADRAMFANAGWDREYWYNEAVKVLDKMAFALSSYQQDQEVSEDAKLDALDRFHQQMREVEDEIPF